MLTTRVRFLLPVCCALLVLSAASARAQERPAPPATEEERQQRLRALEEKVKVLTEEIDSLKTRIVVPEKVEYKSLYGLGPSASKVYQRDRGLSIGGYGEANFSLLTGDKGTGNDTFDFVRLVLYTGFKFTDRILFNSELEFEHARTASTVSAGAGEVSVEFAYLDFRLLDEVNVRGGLLLIPMGFLNEMHEPPTYFGNKRPEVETRIIPSTWRSNGAGLYGTLLPGLDYRTYAVTSFNALGFSNAGFRGGRQAGNREFAESWAWTGRVDYTAIPGLLAGASFFWGDTGQDQRFAGRGADANLVMYDLHAQLEYRGLHLRGLFTQGHLSDADIVTAAVSSANRPVPERIWGAYGEIAYDVLPLIFPGTRQSLSPFLRYERLSTQEEVPAGFNADESRDIHVFNVGVNYKPIPNVVIKLDYRELEARHGEIADELNAGLGFAF
jgi:hypothetical protein